MHWRKYIAEWIYFSKKERLGIYIMGFLITMLWVLPTFFSGGDEIIETLNITHVQLDSMEKLLIKNDRKYNVRAAAPYHNIRFSDTNKPKVRNKLEKKQVININTADSSMLEKLPGIGEKLSARIIKYRDRLGGFINVDQLKEVYGLSDSNFIKFSKLIKIDVEFIPIRIRLNSATYQDMRRHPYLDHVFAKSVLAYVKSHRFISSVDELKTIGSLTEEQILKALPYLDFEH